MVEETVGATVVRYIDELEGSLRYIHQMMEPDLGAAVAQVIEQKREQLGWAGEVSDVLDDPTWLSPGEWRMGDSSDDDFYLYASIENTGCADGQDVETWIGTFCEFGGDGLCFEISTDALGKAVWKKLLASQVETIGQLIDLGFKCDPRAGFLGLPISIDRNLLAGAFENDEFSVALQPIGLAIEQLNVAKPTLDKLIIEIRKFG